MPLIAGWVALILVNVAKGKFGFAVFAFLGSPWSIIGVARLARPDTWWYRNQYDDAKRARALERYGENYWPKSDVRPQPLPPKAV